MNIVSENMNKALHVVLVPMAATAHMIPMMDMAVLFASRGIKTTIICPPAFADPIMIRARDSGLHIGVSMVDFPPQGCELPEFMTTPDWLQQFIHALTMLQQPVEELLHEIRPDAIVSDSFLHWTLDSAAKLGVPRLVFYGSGYLPMCCQQVMGVHKPYRNSYSFVLPNLPHQLTFLRSQVPVFELQKDEEKDDRFIKWLGQMTEADNRSYGAIFNSFYEIEPDYADHWRNVLGRKSWEIGPLFLSNGGGKKSAIDVKDESLVWLDSRTTSGSVVYVCFGSSATFTPAQLRETAIGLEASGQDFIWVVGKIEGDNELDWLPQGFEERVKAKGLIVRGWAPQRSILDHPNVGAFVTHCGWNSAVEGLCAGLPMVTWPVSAEHFYIEKLLTDILRIGVSVGSKQWTLAASEGVASEAIAKAVKDVMIGEDGVEMRRRAKKYKEAANKAVEQGGSSYRGLTNLMEELHNYSRPQGSDHVN